VALTTTITPAEVAVALGREVPASGSPTYAQWQMWIGDALMLIQSRTTELEHDETLIDAAKLDYVIREAVVAQVRRPDDATQVTKAVDDGNVSRMYRTGKGRVDILDEWWTLLGLVTTGGQAFAVDSVNTTTVHQPWCSINFGATYCSCGADLAGYPLWEY
jgi:hypothetical protein